MIYCNWYISGTFDQEFKKIIIDMARALKNNSKNISLNFINKLNPLNTFSGGIWHIFSQKNIEGFETLKEYILRKFHSKVIYTSLENDFNYKKAGLNARLFLNQAEVNDFVISPAFSSNLSEALSGIYITLKTDPFEALKAGILTLRGMSVASKKSIYLDEIIGSENYFLIEDEENDIKKFKRYGENNKGKNLAASARHFLKNNHSDEICSDLLMNLYKNII